MSLNVYYIYKSRAYMVEYRIWFTAENLQGENLKHSWVGSALKWLAEITTSPF